MEKTKRNKLLNVLPVVGVAAVVVAVAAADDLVVVAFRALTLFFWWKIDDVGNDDADDVDEDVELWPRDSSCPRGETEKGRE